MTGIPERAEGGHAGIVEREGELADDFIRC